MFNNGILIFWGEKALRGIDDKISIMLIYKKVELSGKYRTYKGKEVKTWIVHLKNNWKKVVRMLMLR